MDVATGTGLEDLIAINRKHSWYLDRLPDPETRMGALREAMGALRHL